MNDVPSSGNAPQEGDANVQQVNINDIPAWRDPPKEVPFHQRAPLEIARWILSIFAAVCLFCFFHVWWMSFLPGADFDKSTDFLKFMVNSVLPVVTLAVGYYLGDKRSNRDS